MLISSKKILCLAISVLTAFSVCFTGCGKDTQSSVSATEKTTAVAASQPVTKAATSDEQKQEPTWNYSELKRKSADISNTLDDIITSNKYRGTVYVKIGNALEYIGTNGFSDKDRHTKNSTDTCFRIASLTKQFTAVAVMQLVEEEKLSLDDTIDKYFPSYKYGKKITVKNLLTMTAGIKDYINKDGDTDTEAYTESQIDFKVSAKNSAKENKKAVMDWIFNQKLNFEPDEKYMYSNSAYFLLGDIIEQVSKTSYESYVEKNILKPTGMMNTGFESTDKLAVGYQDIYDNAWTLYPGVGYSATSLISNVPDLLKWVDALCTNKLVSEETFKEMTTPYKDNYGYGFVVSEESNAVSHTGKIDKYNAALVFTKDENQIYIALSNYSNSSPIALFNNIQKTLAPFYG
ncbi:serine hydrolase domain-containing protein [Ruminococcus bromii]|uniref:serine hydrolase domain-containing protein n=2 Tax=Ruminococcus TaxID=1263 RepID=UPI0026F00A16|nr:serine hydrolase domain-containing protein [Ruminococcus bromii]